MVLYFAWMLNVRNLPSHVLFLGGLDIKAQEAALRQSPDIVIATPGRLIDHLRNAPSFNLANIEVLVLDEADR
jgi:ATP-dependent RNA helicase DDX27